jgi:pimeloyl-ACP methyl ester carboxylesterase
MRETATEVRTADGTRLHVTLYERDGAGGTGEGPTRDVLCLHGWPNTNRVWRPLADSLLLAAPFRIVAPDLRGFGASDAPEAGYTCAQFADDAIAIAEGLGLSGYALFGHSMGGKLAQVAAARQPAGLAALVLLTPGTVVGAPPGEAASRKAIRGDEAKTAEMLAGWAARPLPEPKKIELVQDALKVSRAAWDGWIDTMRGEDFTAEVGQIAVPTLVVGGGKDPLRSEEELRREVVGRIPGAVYASLPQCGHLPHLEEPTTLAALVVNFLDGLPKGVAQN